MSPAIILPSAEADLDEIWLYIAQDSPRNADRFVARIYRTCHQTLVSNPRIGRGREELAAGLRSFPLGDYIIFYRSIGGGVEVVRILHGNRDIDTEF
ncbi:MAG TPA: type II toxin-antitoxin system RelE/ParE family toxin [Dehalococcoidia bacterium]|nr:type II toxin-antitoxin system RelE/ParE family toxin [Dehalococcoidia bacterium]